jgi:hypothetical protein
MHYEDGRSVRSGSGLWISFHQFRGCIDAWPYLEEPRHKREIAELWPCLAELTFADTTVNAVYTRSVARGLPKGGAAGPGSLAARRKAHSLNGSPWETKADSGTIRIHLRKPMPGPQCVLPPQIRRVPRLISRLPMHPLWLRAPIPTHPPFR